MYALKNPNTMVRYAAQTERTVKKIICPLLGKLLEDCPPDLKPTWNKAEGVYYFPNGSQIHVAGVEGGGSDKLRGTDTHFFVGDECGFWDTSNNGEVMEEAIDAVLIPQTITTKGRGLLISTPPQSAAHLFNMKYCLLAKAENAFLHRTIYDAPHITDAVREKYKQRCGGEDSPTWQREYLARVIIDETQAVIPEFGVMRSVIVRDPGTPPQHRHLYVGMDVGYHDLTFLVFAYYDFKQALLVVEDELVLRRKNSLVVVEAAKEKEKKLWGTREADRRWIDARIGQIQDFRALKYHASKAKHDDRDACINALRLAISQKWLVIHPRCKNLIAHLEGAIWNRNRTEFARNGQFGHFDGVAALMYLVAHVDRTANPYPVGFGLENRSDLTFISDTSDNRQVAALSGLVRRRRR